MPLPATKPHAHAAGRCIRFSKQKMLLSVSSPAGFQSLSKSTRWLAPVRFRPAPPARVDNRNTCTHNCHYAIFITNPMCVHGKWNIPVRMKMLANTHHAFANAYNWRMCTCAKRGNIQPVAD